MPLPGGAVAGAPYYTEPMWKAPASRHNLSLAEYLASKTEGRRRDSVRFARAIGNPIPGMDDRAAARRNRSINGSYELSYQ
jgi:hypothetical protein